MADTVLRLQEGDHLAMLLELLGPDDLHPLIHRLPGLRGKARDHLVD
jgi:hypothetical protein